MRAAAASLKAAAADIDSETGGISAAESSLGVHAVGSIFDPILDAIHQAGMSVDEAAMMVTQMSTNLDAMAAKVAAAKSMMTMIVAEQQAAIAAAEAAGAATAKDPTAVIEGLVAAGAAEITSTDAAGSSMSFAAYNPVRFPAAPPAAAAGGTTPSGWGDKNVAPTLPVQSAGWGDKSSKGVFKQVDWGDKSSPATGSKGELLPKAAQDVHPGQAPQSSTPVPRGGSNPADASSVPSSSAGSMPSADSSSSTSTGSPSDLGSKSTLGDAGDKGASTGDSGLSGAAEKSTLSGAAGGGSDSESGSGEQKSPPVFAPLSQPSAGPQVASVSPSAVAPSVPFAGGGGVPSAPSVSAPPPVAPQPAPMTSQAPQVAMPAAPAPVAASAPVQQAVADQRVMQHASAVASEVPPAGQGVGSASGAAASSSSASSMRGVAAAAFTAAIPASGVISTGPNPDLVLAQTVLEGILAASPRVVGLGWAVSVVATASGAQQVLVTSNEGRGWIPRDLFLPRDVLSPWTYGGPQVAAASVAWENVTDPGRVLAEHAWAMRGRYELRALVSTAAVSAAVRSRFGGAAFATVTSANSALDLSKATDHTCDRLGIADQAVGERIDQVADEALALESLGLAWDGARRLQRVSPMTLPGTPITAVAVREQILTAINSDPERSWKAAPDDLWTRLTELDSLALAFSVGSKFDARDVKLGDLQPDSMSAARAGVCERRVNEMVLLLHGGPSHAKLRDIYFAYDQILGFQAEQAAASA